MRGHNICFSEKRVSELGFNVHQQRGHTETGPRFIVSSERLEKLGIVLAIPGFVVWHVIHYTTATPNEKREKLSHSYPASNPHLIGPPRGTYNTFKNLYVA